MQTRKAREFYSTTFGAPIPSGLDDRGGSFGGVDGSSGGGGDGGGGEGTGGGDPEAKLGLGAADDLFALPSDVVILHVEGMTCGGCASKVKKILESQPQVSSASVDLATETAIVWPVSEAKATPNWQNELGEALAKHLTTCGFKSNLRGGEMISSRQGLPPSWISAASATRVDFEGNVENMLKTAHDDSTTLNSKPVTDVNLSFGERALSAAGAAFISAIIVNPLDVAKVAMGRILVAFVFLLIGEDDRPKDERRVKEAAIVRVKEGVSRQIVFKAW